MAKLQVPPEPPQAMRSRSHTGQSVTRDLPEGEESHDNNGDQELDHQDGINLQ